MTVTQAGPEAGSASPGCGILPAALAAPFPAQVRGGRGRCDTPSHNRAAWSPHHRSRAPRCPCPSPQAALRGDPPARQLRAHLSAAHRPSHRSVPSTARRPRSSLRPKHRQPPAAPAQPGPGPQGPRGAAGHRLTAVTLTRRARCPSHSPPLVTHSLHTLHTLTHPPSHARRARCHSHPLALSVTRTHTVSHGHTPSHTHHHTPSHTQLHTLTHTLSQSQTLCHTLCHSVPHPVTLALTHSSHGLTDTLPPQRTFRGLFLL